MCGVLACREDQLDCTRSGRHVPASVLFCDGVHDCSDGVDERDNCGQPAFYIYLTTMGNRKPETGNRETGKRIIQLKDWKTREWKTHHSRLWPSSKTAVNLIYAEMKRGRFVDSSTV